MPSRRVVVLAWAARDELGGSDCEQVRDAVLAQPAATVTSLAYVVVGVLLAWWWRGLPAGARGAPLGYAALLGLTGLGSIAYHGPQPAGAGAMHDLPIVALLMLAVGVPVVRSLRGRQVLAIGSRGPRVVAGLAAIVAGVAYLAGRTGSPLCEPESLLQPHGLWHVASAVTLAAWGAALWPPGASRPSEPPRPRGRGPA